MVLPGDLVMQPFEKIPRVPMTRLLGQVFAKGAQRYEMREMQTRVHREYGPVVAMGRGRFTNVFLFGPDANRAVLLERAQSLSSRAPWMQIMGTIFPNGLLLRDGAEHRHHRKIMHEAFKRPVLREYVERMNPAVARGLEGFGGAGGSVRAFDAFKRLTLDIAAAIFVGVDLGSESRRMTEAFEAMVAAAMPGPKIPYFGRHHRGVVGRRYMLGFLRSMLEKKRGDAGADLFSRLCRARSESGEFFTDTEVLDHMVFLMMAAHDTTTSTLTSMTYELAAHPEWQERIREESLALGDPHPDFDALDRLESLTLVMKETLRRYPPLPVIPRSTLGEFEWEGYRIPKRTMVVVSPIHTHYMPEWWEAPERFDPERFGPGRAEHARHTHSWIPFGGGTHMCIGRRFAEAQVRLVMHQLVRRYRFRVPEGYRMPVQQAPISKPTDGLPIDLEPIESA
jgi:cytochrome P450